MLDTSKPVFNYGDEIYTARIRLSEAELAFVQNPNEQTRNDVTAAVNYYRQVLADPIGAYRAAA